MLKYQLQNVRLSSSQAAITLSSIPNTYDDLYVVLSVRSTNADDGLFFRFNNTTANTSWRNLLGYSTGVLSQSGTGWLAGGGVRSNPGTSDYTNVGIYIPNYAGSSPKTASVDSVSPENGNNGYQFLVANLWNDTAAINRIDFYMQGGSMASGSKVSVYGIKRGSSGEVNVASGGVITTSGGYTIHTFNSSGTFVANKPLEVEYVVTAGGGGGGATGGGGGGAGGYRSSVAGELSGGGASAESKLFLTPSSYQVIVGAGGAGGPVPSNPASNGSPSSFASVLSIGGGAGGGEAVGASGGSGGGGGQSGSRAGGAGTSGQGYAGGSSPSSGVIGGGGGGAGAAGANGTSSNGGNGGNGVASVISGTSTYRAGGGGGGVHTSATAGAGGLGGGGASAPFGNNADTGTAGTANTGGGGGAGSGRAGQYYGNGAAGGSGVVIIRYLTPA